MIQKELSCCWQCVECDDHQFLPNETTCQDCPMGWEPNDNKDGQFFVYFYLNQACIWFSKETF